MPRMKPQPIYLSDPDADACPPFWFTKAEPLGPPVLMTSLLPDVPPAMMRWGGIALPPPMRDPDGFPVPFPDGSSGYDSAESWALAFGQRLPIAQLHGLPVVAAYTLASLFYRHTLGQGAPAVVLDEWMQVSRLLLAYMLGLNIVEWTPRGFLDPNAENHLLHNIVGFADVDRHGHFTRNRDPRCASCYFLAAEGRPPHNWRERLDAYLRKRSLDHYGDDFRRKHYLTPLLLPPTQEAHRFPLIIMRAARVQLPIAALPEWPDDMMRDPLDRRRGWMPALREAYGPDLIEHIRNGLARTNCLPRG